jgi:hypothetical protein
MMPDRRRRHKPRYESLLPCDRKRGTSYILASDSWSKTVSMDKIKKILSQASTESKTYFVELHIGYPAPSFPTLTQLESDLILWRNLTDKSNMGFLSFTLVREPVSFAISFFNYFFGGKTGRWNPFPNLNVTEENFQKTLVPNRQCVVFDTHPMGMNMKNQSSLQTDASCNVRQVQNVLLEQMDWVGTTEKLQTETLPLLSEILIGNATIGIRKSPKNVAENRNLTSIRQSDLLPKTLEWVQNSTRLDQQIHDTILESFSLEKFGMHFSERFGHPNQRK